MSRGTPSDLSIWLQQRATAIDNIVPLFGDARILAIADATHGTHEFFDVKRRLVPTLAANGFNILAFEAPYAEFDALREGAEPANVIQSADYFFWDANEVLDTIRFAEANGIEVAGIDCAHPHSAIDMVLTYLARVDRDARARAATQYGCLRQYGAATGGYMNLPPSLKESCRADITQVLPVFAASRDAYIAKSSLGEYEHVVHAARVVEQGERALATNPPSRDACMAENLEWLFAQRPDAKIVVWGHNEHFGKAAYTLNGITSKSTGTYVSEKYGDGYRAIGSIALDGSFWAFDPMWQITEQFLPAASDDDYATMFASLHRAEMFVSFAGSLPSWFGAPHRLRIAGSTPGAYEITENLAKRFDGIIYIEMSTPSQLRHFPRLRN